MTAVVADLGLTAYEVAVVFPFHLGFDSGMRILQVGPALGKLAPGVEVGHELEEHFLIETPAAATFAAMCEAPSSLVVFRARRRSTVLRGQTIWYPRQNALLFLCSPWLTSTSELQRHGLSLADFAVHDPMADLLQVLQAQESTLLDVRKLVSKLSAQRKEQRAAGARMAALYEITRILGAGASVADVAQQVLEQCIGILHFPVLTLWLADANEQVACIAPGAGSAEARELARRLTEDPPDFALDVWAPTETPLARRYDAAASAGGRTHDAANAGFPVAYQFQIEGAGGVLGAVEAYGTVEPSNERALLETMAEVALRLGQFIDKTRADAALRSTIKVAAAAAAAKSQFLARMSHEIRTPINGVLGMIELALSGALGETQRTQLETARSSGELLLGLVNDVLDFSKIEAGHLEVDDAPFDVRACLQRAYKLFEPRAAAKRLRFELVIDPALPSVVCGDELRLSQVLVNLIGNAMKFTKAGAVRVEASLLGDAEGELSLAVAVTDTGIGIPESRRDAIFAAFTQAELATAREFGGTGLGLTICKQLVALMGGELTVASEVGEGSTFQFVVRLGKVAQEAPRRVAQQEGAVVGRPLHVLVVEDNEINQAVVRGLLERDGHTVEIVDRMEAAISRGCAGIFDAILMDVQLPDGDGLMATNAIRVHSRLHGTAEVPIIGLSAQAVAGDRERALAAGMDDYLTKPVRPAQLAATLRQLCVAAPPSQRRRSTSLRAVREPVVEPRGQGGGAGPDLGVGLGASWSPADEQAFLGKVAEYADLGDMIFTMARTLATEATARWQEIEHKVEQGELARVGFLVHSLAGSAGTIGFSSVEKASRALERALRDPPSGGPGELAAEVEALRATLFGLQQFVGSQAFTALEAQATSAAPAGTSSAG